jgi:menaquinone-specific isochorismate synthase
MEVAPRDLLAWLRAQKSVERAYWQSRDGSLEIAAVGQAWTVNSRNTPGLAHGLAAVRTCLDEGAHGIRVIGGTAFDPTAPVSEPWQALGTYAFWVPRVEMVRRGQACSVAVNGYSEDLSQLLAHCQTLADFDTTTHTLPKARVLALDPPEAMWHRQVAALTADLGPSLNKLVLACQCQIRLEGPTDPCTLLQVLRGASQGSYDFMIQTGETAFVGRTPECLYRREGSHVTTEALAGTGGRAAALRKSKKEILEHDYVIQDIEAALHSVCRDIRTGHAREVVSWGSLQHLCTRFQATLREGKHDEDLLRSLHPSAAVLGFPRPAAHRVLRAYETFSRGWYAGPVGWISREAAEFAVGIRSALLCGRALTLYAGAGIVMGSRPAREWQELQDKMRPFMDALGVTS